MKKILIAAIILLTLNSCKTMQGLYIAQTPEAEIHWDFQPKHKYSKTGTVEVVEIYENHQIDGLHPYKYKKNNLNIYKQHPYRRMQLAVPYQFQKTQNGFKIDVEDWYFEKY